MGLGCDGGGIQCGCGAGCGIQGRDNRYSFLVPGPNWGYPLGLVTGRRRHHRIGRRCGWDHP